MFMCPRVACPRPLGRGRRAAESKVRPGSFDRYMEQGRPMRRRPRLCGPSRGGRGETRRGESARDPLVGRVGAGRRRRRRRDACCLAVAIAPPPPSPTTASGRLAYTTVASRRLCHEGGVGLIHGLIKSVVYCKSTVDDKEASFYSS
ncbi:hypothetical protein R5R35_009853 [Gryllus longicercus]|uniref:Uncharacterized protein n=1 Tax=Gryllus longicercus TaxID=2509291 RepID=A0AAN9Z725_9ORTH